MSCQPSEGSGLGGNQPGSSAFSATTLRTEELVSFSESQWPACLSLAALPYQAHHSYPPASLIRQENLSSASRYDKSGHGTRGRACCQSPLARGTNMITVAKWSLWLE